jgi:hypothetical protein
MIETLHSFLTTPLAKSDSAKGISGWEAGKANQGWNY